MHLTLRKPLGFLALLAILLPLSASAQGDRMLIDYVDVSRYEKAQVVRYYIDILDRKNMPIPEQDKDKMSFYVDDESIDPEMIKDLDVRTFKEVGEPIAVGIIITNYAGYVPKSETEQSLFKQSKAGITEFLRELAQNKDQVGVWLYNEKSNINFYPFSNNIDGAIDAINELEDTPPPKLSDSTEEQGKVETPNFYRYWEAVVRKMSELEDLPRRRILVVISDGVGEFAADRKDQIDKRLGRIINAAKDSGIKIYAFGASLQTREFIPYLRQASSETAGVFTDIDDAEKLDGAVRELAPQIKKQYVVDLTVPGMPHEDKVKLRVDAETPSGQKVSAVYGTAVKFTETPTNWTRILWICLYVFLGLIGLWLFIKIIKGIVRWTRREKTVVEEEWEEEPEYDGPDRGKLRVKSGPLAGTVFPLIEDITTIGSIEGNHVVLYDEGVSKRHAGIKIEEMRYELADFGSTNGTWVNGRKINKQFLRDGDEIRIGNSEMTFNLK